MIKKYTHKSITWIDAANPTNDEIKALIEEYDINPNIAKDLHLPTTANYKEKVIVHGKSLYMVMHFPALRHSHAGDTDQEIDFIVGKKFIITTRYEPIDALERFAKNFEVNDILGKHLMQDNAGYVLYYIIKELYMSISDELDTINDMIKVIERNIFQGNEKKLVAEISRANRDLISLKHIVFSHQTILEHIEKVSEKIFDKEFAEHFQEMIDEYYRIENVLMNNVDFLTELRNTNDSLLSLKQGETMKVLTIMAFVTYPLTLISSIFGMNTHSTPIIGMPNDFWIVMILMILLATLFFIFFKIKKWL